MTRALRTWCLLAALGCAGDDEGPSPSAADTATLPTCEELSWANTGRPFVTTWCTGCHSSELGEGERSSAPVGVDLDTYAGVLQWAERVEATAVGDDARMPPVGGATDVEKERLGLWLSCGLPGPPEGADFDCAEASEVAWSASVCGAGTPVRIAGDVATGAVDASCVCSVSGDLELTAGEQDWPMLEAVGGTVELSGAASMHAPRLLDVGALEVHSGVELDLGRLVHAGGVSIQAPELAHVDLHDLADVDGDVEVVGNPALAHLDLSRLAVVGGSLILDDNDQLPTVLGELYGLRSIGGDLRIVGHASWQGFYGCGLLETVGGDVELSGNGRFGIVNGFTALTQVGGDVRVEGNPQLQFLEGFDQLETVGADLVVAGNSMLVREDAFALLRQVGGEARVSANARLEEVAGLPALEEVGALVWEDDPELLDIGPHPSLHTVHGDLVLRRLHALGGAGGFGALETLGGAWVVDDLDGLSSLQGFAALTAVGTDLVVQGNDSLGDASALESVVQVGGDLRLVDNPSLSEDALGSWLDAVSVDGTTELSGNGP